MRTTEIKNEIDETDTYESAYALYEGRELTRTYINKIENRIIKTGYYLELLTPKTMKLLGSAKSKINKHEMVKTCLF